LALDIFVAAVNGGESNSEVADVATTLEPIDVGPAAELV
jgi:hypothetical protein